MADFIDPARKAMYESDRGERRLYEKPRTKQELMKSAFKLPLTKDGCEAIIQIVCGAMDLPYDDLAREDFAGWVHSMDRNTDVFTFASLMKVFHCRMAKTATWILDQEAKERQKSARLEREAKTKLEETKLSLAPDGSGRDESTDAEGAPATQ